ncbi:hypothetical protein XBKB1_2710002 [Xenorhabdus bovienii str. kraussei Becker Underwood]|uniref:Uncharacterized protein n=1 Tax=Xenorhabdus bovienii str. kraussei Becker Underwood TaxID=1398204 RepID=A0A077PUC9_XENBV|nr:hypothetical protein XBKB1_2710002 [Xenorhabdus bovienii str. kraussei Becker Underwood]
MIRVITLATMPVTVTVIVHEVKTVSAAAEGASAMLTLHRNIHPTGSQQSLPVILRRHFH